MSNKPRKHLHRPRENRTARARKEWEQGRIPCVPGVIADRTQESIDQALAEAHHTLPYIPGTQVCLRILEVEQGLVFVAEKFPGALATIRNLLAAKGGVEPCIVIATREPHER